MSWFRSSPFLLAYAQLMLAMLLWGSNAVIARLSVIDMPPIGVSFWRWFAAAAVLLPFTAREIVASWRVLLAHWRILIVLSVLGPVAFNGFVYVGLQTTAAVNSAIANGATPLATVIAAYVVLSETVGWRTHLGMASAFLGVVAIVLRGDPAVLATLAVNEGDILILIGVLCWGFYTVLLKFRPPGVSPLALVAVLMIIGMIVIAPAYAWEIGRGRYVEVTVSNLALIIYAGAVISVFANVCMIRAVSVVGANVTGQFNNLIPIFGSAASVAFLGEAFEVYHAAGIVLVLIGVYLAAIDRRR